MTLPNRKLPRLQGYDYSTPNYYFVTICTHDKQHLFGTPDNLSLLGTIAQAELQNLSSHYSCVFVDKYVVMPNHIHAIIAIVYQHNNIEKAPSLSSIIGLYKSGVSRQIHEISPALKVWQASFYDRVIRSERGYQEAWQYVDENPVKWRLLKEADEYYPAFPENE